MSFDNPAEEARRWIEAGEPPYETVEEATEYLALVERAERDERELRWLEEDAHRDELSGDAERHRHLERALEISSVRRKFENSADGYCSRAARVIHGREDERLPDDEFRNFYEAADRLVTDSRRAEALRKLEKRERLAAKVVREPGPYGDATSPHSWIRDVLVWRDPQTRALMDGRMSSDMSDQAVEQRLGRHARDVHRALLKRNKYGKTIARTISEARRQDDASQHEQLFRTDLNALRFAEIRSVTTGGGTTASASGGGAAAFVPPAFLIDHVWAEYRSPYRSFADQLNTSVPLPDYGLEVYLTIVTSGSVVATQTELAGVSEGDPVASFANSQIVAKVGQVALSQQFLDRAGPGMSGDAVLFRQLKEQLDAQIDAYAIAQALAGAASVTNSGSFALTNGATAGVGGFMGDLKKAKSKLTDTAGIRLRGTHVFAQDDFIDYIGAWSDSQGRPAFSPSLDDNRLPVRSQGDQTAEGYSGYIVNGLALFGDSNIPTSSSNLQIVVCRPDSILQLEGAPITYLYPPTFAGNLEAVLGVRCYVATIARFPAGVSVISGSAYAASTFA